MIKFERTFNAQLIRECITHPRVWPYVTDDSAPAPEDYQPVLDTAIYWVAVYDEQDYFIGLFHAHPHNAVCYEVHTILLPDAWGQAEVIARAAIKWGFANTPAKRFITNVPDGNVLAKRLARRSGMALIGVNHKSLLKNGILVDQTLYGISA